jgi:cell filamentation protein
MTALRSEEPFPPGRLGASHYRAIHRHLFQDVYVWAGQYRTLRMSKDGSAFCYPEHIKRELARLVAILKAQKYLRELSRAEFPNACAEFLATLNAIHPFREGNGRTQTAFMAMVADRAGHPLILERLAPLEFLAAMVASFKGDNAPLKRQLFHLTDV